MQIKSIITITSTSDTDRTDLEAENKVKWLLKYLHLRDSFPETLEAAGEATVDLGKLIIRM